MNLKNTFDRLFFVKLPKWITVIFMVGVLLFFIQCKSDVEVTPYLIQEIDYTRFLPELKVNDIFQEKVANTTAPKVLDTLGTVTKDEIVVTKIHFESVVDKDRINKLFAYLIRPKGKTNLPAILILHGGAQTSDNYFDLGIQFAKRGYACLIPDLPGFASPESANRNGTGSTGKWTAFPYGAKHFEVMPTGRNCVIYEGVVAALQAFYLLKSQPFVNPDAIGIRGLSWGGYATTITTALLGKQVKAGFAVFGSGFYDLPSYFKSILDQMDTESRNIWLSSLDAGRYADRIQSPFYFMAASNDTYFHAPAVMTTYDRIKGPKYILFAPNSDHNLTNVPEAQNTEFAFFDYYLKNIGEDLPLVSGMSANRQTDGSVNFEFELRSNRKIKEVKLWYSSGEYDWMKKKWKSKVAEPLGNLRFKTALPADVVLANGNWYVIVTDEKQVSNGTKIF